MMDPVTFRRHLHAHPELSFQEHATADFISRQLAELGVEQRPVARTGILATLRGGKTPESNRKNAGFTDEERGKFAQLLAAGFTDTFRYFYPDQTDIYSWWSYRFKAREKNAGWRIDYFLVSASLDERLRGAKIHTDIYGSDHCPVELNIDL